MKKKTCFKLKKTIFESLKNVLFTMKGRELLQPTKTLLLNLLSIRALWKFNFYFQVKIKMKYLTAYLYSSDENAFSDDKIMTSAIAMCKQNLLTINHTAFIFN